MKVPEMSYEEWLVSKKVTDPCTGLKVIPELNPMLFPFQHDVVAWALKRGRACIFSDCGTGKTAMQRTKALGLLHKQIKKDSAMSRQGIPDYLVTMRKPGINTKPIEGEFDHYEGDEEFQSNGRMSIDIWQRYASPVWMDINPSDTLQYRNAKEDKDGRHICPLQLQVIHRALQLWSLPGDVVYSPFGGIASEGWESVKLGRKFVGTELKESYWIQAVKNLKEAEKLATSGQLDFEE